MEPRLETAGGSNRGGGDVLLACLDSLSSFSLISIKCRFRGDVSDDDDFGVNATFVEVGLVRINSFCAASFF